MFFIDLYITNLFYFRNDPPGQRIGLRHRFRFGIYADDRFRIRFAQVYPILREIDFNTVRIVHFFISITGFHFTQYFIHVDSRCQLDLVLRGEIGRIGLAQLGQGHTFFGQIGQEKRGADQCVAAVVQFGVDDPAVALRRR